MRDNREKLIFATVKVFQLALLLHHFAVELKQHIGLALQRCFLLKDKSIVVLHIRKSRFAVANVFQHPNHKHRSPCRIAHKRSSNVCPHRRTVFVHILKLQRVGIYRTGEQFVK